MKKLLFIDRDGTLIMEPPVDRQVDSLEKLQFYPGVFQNLAKLVNLLDFELVIVSNQDGLGTASFPEDTFWPAQNKMLAAFKNEGIEFTDVLIDRSLPEENAPTRKPRTGLLSKYMKGSYDMANSFVIGDRITDVELAKNLGCQAIFFNKDDQADLELSKSGLDQVCQFISADWKEVVKFLLATERSATIERHTAETKISVSINLDGNGVCNIKTGLYFFDHMLEQIGRHSGCDLSIKAVGDLHVDEHHTIEDAAIVLGEAFKKALGDKRGIERYGFCLPMDDCLAQVALDFGGRSWLEWEADFKREMIGDMPTEMFYHFFKSFSDAAACNLNIKAEGKNEHHKIEGIFKALAKAIKAAVRKDPFNNSLPSTKEML